MTDYKDIKYDFSGANLTALNATQLTSGTTPDARYTTLPAVSGVNLTSLNATNLGSGTVPTARLGTGTASSSTVLYGDNTWAAGGGDVEKVASGAFTTSVIDLQGCFTSTYKFYKLFWGGYSITSGGYPVVGFLDSSHNLITGTDIYESLLDSFSSTSWTTTPVTYEWA